MLYVEVRRVRRVLVWFTSIVVAIAALILVATLSGHHGPHTTSPIDFSGLLEFSVFAPLIVASFLANDLSAETVTLPILWTRPVSRATIAWRFVAVDLVGLVLAYAIVVVLSLAMMAIFGLLPQLVFDAVNSILVACVVLAASLMLYALVWLISARFGRAGAITGCLWAAMIVLGILYANDLPPLLHSIVLGLSYLSPLAWLGNLHSNVGGENVQNGGPAVIPLSIGWRALGAFCIALVALVASVRLWSTREV
jgi:hypothetical protein